MGIFLNLFGIIGSICAGAALSKANADMLFANKMIACVSLVAFAGFFVVTLFDNHTLWAEYLVISVLGFVNIPIFFVAYELAVKQTAHLGVGEALPCGIINMMANAIGFAEVFLLTPVLRSETKVRSEITMTLIFLQ